MAFVPDENTDLFQAEEQRIRQWISNAEQAQPDCLLTEEEIAQDTPKEIIDKKLYNKRLATFGCTMGCGTLALLFALPLLFGSFVRLDFEMLFLGLFFGVPGILLFLYGRSEWKRNKRLKAEGKVRDQ